MAVKPPVASRIVRIVSDPRLVSRITKILFVYRFFLCRISYTKISGVGFLNWRCSVWHYFYYRKLKKDLPPANLLNTGIPMRKKSTKQYNCEDCVKVGGKKKKVYGSENADYKIMHYNYIKHVFKQKRSKRSKKNVTSILRSWSSENVYLKKFFNSVL